MNGPSFFHITRSHRPHLCSLLLWLASSHTSGNRSCFLTAAAWPCPTVAPNYVRHWLVQFLHLKATRQGYERCRDGRHHYCLLQCHPTPAEELLCCRPLGSH